MQEIQKFRIMVIEKIRRLVIFICPASYWKGLKYDSLHFCLYYCHWIFSIIDSHFDRRMADRKICSSEKEISSLRIIQAVFRFILWITGVKVTVIGEENVPRDAPVLYIGNHRSYFDILLTYSRCPIRTGYIAKRKWNAIRFFPTGCVISTVFSWTARISGRD